MSLFGGGGECSAGANPLAQFTKHTAEDRSLQRGNLGGNALPANQSMRQEMHMNQRDQQSMNNFFQVNRDNFQFQPMRNELNHMAPLQPQQQQQSLNQSWSKEFNPLHAQQQPLNPQMSSSKWTSEFHGATSSNANAPLQVNGSINSNSMLRTRMSNFSPMYSSGMNMMRSSSLMGQPVAGTSSEIVNDEGKWDDKFKEIDDQMNEEDAVKEEMKDVNKEPEIIIDDKYNANFDEVWDSLNQRNQDMTDSSWEKDFSTYAEARYNFGAYQFEENNQFLNTPNAYEIGLTLMENGARLSEAALAFEAAVKEDPKHVDAWLKLGEVQTQNEKEGAGLTALEKCLSLDPKNLSALMTLAVSYINEGYDNAAFATLERWIETKYPQVTNKARNLNPDINDEDRFSLSKRVTELFIKAAQLSPTGANIDADVQLGLGVLFYANEEFDKTIDCFKAAINVRPNDELLWNRLGASLANSNRSEEAIEAYYKALQLKPTFVRARYNLGVSSINIGCYKEAAEHLLSALSMHQVEGVKNEDFSSNQSTTILETLKRAFLAMNRRDLLEKVQPNLNLDQFRGEFNF